MGLAYDWNDRALSPTPCGPAGFAKRMHASWARPFEKWKEIMMDTSTQTVESQTWVAFGPAGALGSVHRIDGGFTFRLLTDDGYRATYPSLEVAKSALFAALEPGSDWPEFREH